MLEKNYENVPNSVKSASGVTFYIAKYMKCQVKAAESERRNPSE